jgi:hypothetical protein
MSDTAGLQPGLFNAWRIQENELDLAIEKKCGQEPKIGRVDR